MWGNSAVVSAATRAASARVMGAAGAQTAMRIGMAPA